MFTDKDKLYHKGLIKILEEGNFELKGKEVPAFNEIYLWTKQLIDRKSKDQTEKVEK